MKSQRVKNHDRWDRELKREFAWLCWCERCGTTAGRLDIAHSQKRFDIKTRDEYFTFARLCRPCHEFAEFGTHERMAQIIEEIAGNRSIDTMHIA